MNTFKFTPDQTPDGDYILNVDGREFYFDKKDAIEWIQESAPVGFIYVIDGKEYKRNS